MYLYTCRFTGTYAVYIHVLFTFVCKPLSLISALTDFFLSCRLVSETSGCFTDKQKVSHGKPATSTSAGAPPLPPAAAAAVDVSRSTSNVFRSGDYDLPSHASRGHFLTVQQQDYRYRDRAPPAGVSTTTKKAYSHVLPRSENKHFVIQMKCVGGLSTWPRNQVVVGFEFQL